MEKNWHCLKCHTSDYHDGDCPKCNKPFKKLVIRYNMVYILLFIRNLNNRLKNNPEIYGVYSNKQQAINDGEELILPNIKNYTIEEWDLDTNQLIRRQIITTKHTS